MITWRPICPPSSNLYGGWLLTAYCDTSINPKVIRLRRYNSDSVDLLFINVRRKSDRCLNVEHLTRDATNIRVECIDNAQDKRMIREWLCGKWDCSREQQALVDEELSKKADPIHVGFKAVAWSNLSRMARQRYQMVGMGRHGHSDRRLSRTLAVERCRQL